jgi:hypothetical protein
MATSVNGVPPSPTRIRLIMAHLLLPDPPVDRIRILQTLPIRPTTQLIK